MAYNEMTKSIAVKKNGKGQKKISDLKQFKLLPCLEKTRGNFKPYQEITFKLLALPEYSPSPDVRTH